MKLFLYLNQENYIVNYSNLPSYGYIEVPNWNERYPNGIDKGWLKYVDGEFVVDEELKKIMLTTSDINYSKMQGEVNIVEERLQHGMENTKVIKASVETLEEQLANEILANFEKDVVIKQLEEKLQVATTTNNELTEQLANETMNAFELESRVSTLEELMKGGADHE